MNKFIVTDGGILRFGNVNLHKNLLLPNEHCIGGGEYTFTYGARTTAMQLSGRSYDFGRVKWNHVDCVTLPATLRGIDITYEGLPLSDFVKIRYE